MASSEGDIIETALAHIGESQASTNNPNYTLAQSRLPDVRDRVLAEFRWNFAMKLGFLSEGSLPSNLPENYSFPYAYTIPGDCVRVVGPSDPNESLENYGLSNHIVWKVVGNLLYSDKVQKDTDDNDGLWVWYVSRVTDVSLWDSLFAELVAIELAQAIGFRASSNPQAIAQLEQRRQRISQRAKVMNAQENSPEIFSVDAGWPESRYGYAGNFNRNPWRYG